jgi:ribosomal protein S27E
MGIKVEFNPDLALRNIEEYKKGNCKIEECVPETLIKGQIYEFLKADQRHYCMVCQSPLVETKGKGKLSKELAAVRILEVTHFFDATGKVWTKGKYKVEEVFDKNDNRIHFQNCTRVFYDEKGGYDTI